jgi:hypothetical protein
VIQRTVKSTREPTQTDFGGFVQVGADMLHPFELPERLERGWPLLTVETEANGDSRSTHEMDPFLGWFAGLVVAIYKRFLSCLGCSSWPSTKYVFPRHTLFYYICLHCPASWAISYAASPVFFSIYIWYLQWAFCFIIQYVLCTPLFQDLVGIKTVLLVLLHNVAAHNVTVAGRVCYLT